MEPDRELNQIFRLTPYQKMALNKLGLKTARDLLYHFPFRFEEPTHIGKIINLKKGDAAVVYGVINKLKTQRAFYKKIPMAEGILEDETGKIKIIWFNQPYLAKMLSEGAPVMAEGKVAERKGELYFANPKIERVASLPIGKSEGELWETLENSTEKSGEIHLRPYYPESRGVTSNWFYHAIARVLRSGILDSLEDPLPESIRKKYLLPSLKTSLVWIHSPKNQNDAAAARKRFAFEEVFFIQIQKQIARREYEANPSFKIEVDDKLVKSFLERFPFTPTNAQMRAITAIFGDFKKGKPMMRLLEGDVGSGKTFVAAATAYATIETPPKENTSARLQVALMAPTEILAKQHFESFMESFSHMRVSIALITSGGCQKFPSKLNPKGATGISRVQLLRWVKDGQISIVIGTHSLIQKTVEFKNLAYAVVDEQHRFGTSQRQKIVQKSKMAPHLLSMTATPIPRTLALTVFGDLDLTLLDEMPPGRKQIITKVVAPKERKETYETIKKEIIAGRQAYVVCPRIDEPDPEKEMALDVKSVKEETERLRKEVFPEFKIEMIHGKMKSDERDEVMREFKKGKINILVATSVIEVGVNVPNATTIVIEGAERFGLAQLHQLRGRVLRSTHQSYCYVFTSSANQISAKRLKALGKTSNGFELAEYDLKFRGAGDLAGLRQWGISDVAMEALQNLKMVEVARAEAMAIIDSDPELSKYPFLKEKMPNAEEDIHFE